jgi:putative transposase
MREGPEFDPRTHRKRCRRWNQPGHAHFLTFSCFQRRPFLSRDRSRGWFVDAVRAARTKHCFDLWAYVIMPEHAHLIVFPTRPSYDVSAILKSIKQAVSYAAIAYVRTHAPEFMPQMTDHQPSGKVSLRFWQRGGGHDRNLFSTGEIWEKVEYVNNNPVERGLCARADEWPWSSAADYAGTGVGPLELQLDQLPRF